MAIKHWIYTRIELSSLTTGLLPSDYNKTNDDSKYLLSIAELKWTQEWHSTKEDAAYLHTEHVRHNS